MTDISKVAIESWAVDDIKPYPYNHKKHPEKQIEMLSKSIKVQGLLDPIVVDKEGVIISGHGRFEAIKRLNWVKVSVRVLRDITDDQASALRIAANKTVSNEYDTDMLSRELRSLSEASFDLDSLGFDERELSMLIADVGEIDQDSLVLDLDAAVADHEEDVTASSDRADEDNVRLDKAFGFKNVPLRDQKVVSRFMAEIEASTGLTAQEALLTHMRDYLAGAAE